MATAPWIFAVHHLPAGTDSRYLLGDGGFSSLGGTTSIVNDTDLGRAVLQESSGAGANVVTKLIPEGMDRLVFSFRIRPMSSGGSTVSENNVVVWNNTNGAMLRITNHRDTQTYRLLLGNTLLASLGTITFGGNWTTFEIAVHFHASEGQIIVRRDNTELYNQSGIQTSAVTVGTGATEIVVRKPVTGTSSSSVRLTDFYLKDFPTTGNPFFGSISPRWRTVISDIANSGWVADTGSDLFDRIKQVDPGYIESDGPGDEVELELDDVPVSSNSIIAVVPLILGEAPDGGNPLVSLDLKRGANETMKSGRSLGSGIPGSQTEVHLTQPDGSAWDFTSANEVSLVLRSS